MRWDLYIRLRRLPNGQPWGLREAWFVPHRVGGPGCAEHYVRFENDEFVAFEINAWKFHGDDWREQSVPLMRHRECYAEYEVDDLECLGDVLPKYLAYCASVGVDLQLGRYGERCGNDEEREFARLLEADENWTHGAAKRRKEEET